MNHLLYHTLNAAFQVEGKTLFLCDPLNAKEMKRPPLFSEEGGAIAAYASVTQATTK